MTNPILITGGAGSVGRQLASMFLEEERRVRIFDLPFMDFTGLDEDPNVEVYKGDITDPKSVSKAAEGISGVLHLAAILPPNSEKDKEFTHHNGNSEPQGFGHIGFSVPDVYQASERFEKLGVKFIGPRSKFHSIPL